MYPVSRKGSAYDRVATMFSPDGRLYQVEYAGKIVEQGTIGAALVYDDGVLFGADKKISSKLIIPKSVEKLFKIDDHVGAISAGLVGDARRLVQIARKESQENKMYYEEKIPVETLVKHVSGVKQLFTQYAGMRPFGVSFIMGGVDDTGPRLFETEPSGALAEYKAIAIGKDRKEAMKVFEKKYKEGIDFEAGIKLITEALEAARDDKEKSDVNRLEFTFISNGGSFERIETQKLKSILGKK
ncbi:MAG: proteasome subunit alpha [Candidatus Diapherotrites archaeon]|uniref:Proteasome subunit alpha n=1 Tax=Candidatus Iainarchaeum sp. TaxID=3101447 RepID=A0A2D6M1G8_9ARCH|nr:proteasome subunit alpha [Candidatus Diapherotrites archaeon]|tara:strand:+ start:3419 stop:4144 length:726 start_codon:yes stop_codon:yes gene_type:complete